MNRTVVILLSDKRSGSTMLERELAKHASIRHVEYCIHTFNETHHWLKSAVLLDQPARHFAGGRRYKNYGPRIAVRTYLIDQIRGNVPDFSVPINDRDLVTGGWEALCDRFAQPVFFEKSPQHPAHWAALSLMANWAAETSFDVKFIELTRNPSAVLYSAWRLFGTDPGERQHGWTEIQRNLLAFRTLVASNQLLQVRYEDLIGDPSTEFDRIQRFIGVQPQPEVGAAVHGGSLTKWRDDETFGYRASDSMIQMAQAFGYMKPDVLPPRTKCTGARPRGRWENLREVLRNRIVVPLGIRSRRKG